MLNLREKLSRLKSEPKINKNAINSELMDYEKLGKTLGGRVLSSDEGQIIHFKTEFDIDHCYNHFPNGNSQICPIGIRTLSNMDEIIDFLDFENILFLDTETTGLAGGTGTIAFLTGIGYFLDNNFVVEQIFLPDYGEEEAFLEYLRSRFSKYDVLVTYNGKSYDLNLLKYRYRMNRIEFPFNQSCHLDLLHTSRQLWKNRLDRCGLQDIEKQILNIHRKEDIPGSQIPQAYFDFLSHQKIDTMPLIIQHNQMDILSLALLLIWITQTLGNPFHQQNTDVQDLYSLGRLFKRKLESSKAIACFEKAAGLKTTTHTRDAVYREWGEFLKSSKQWSEAVDVWSEWLNNDPLFPEEPLVELAKYYEHQARDYQKAIQIVERAKEAIINRRNLNRALKVNTNLAEWDKRYCRLCRKIKNKH